MVPQPEAEAGPQSDGVGPGGSLRIEERRHEMSWFVTSSSVQSLCLRIEGRKDFEKAKTRGFSSFANSVNVSIRV